MIAKPTRHDASRGLERCRAALLCALLCALGTGAASAAQVEGDTATFAWSPASGPVAGYFIYVSRDGGPFQLEASVPPTPTQAGVRGAEGETLTMKVVAYDANGNTGPDSAPSAPIEFVASVDPGAGGGPPVTASELPAVLGEAVYAAATGSDGRLFVVERQGRIRILENGVVRDSDFLNLSGVVGTAGDGGLLGLAFDPDYARNGLFYVLYTDLLGATVVSRFEVGQAANAANAASEEILLTVDQPYDDHNGATLAFGADGYLYVALGDGGSLGDPGNRAQDGDELLGKLLRLDVSAGAGMPAEIPADNPFVGNPAVRDEIWALGLRDPYRFAFDSGTGDLWIGDVGEARQEVHLEAAGDPGGRNYGWDILDGTTCNPNDPTPAPPCDDASLEEPIYEYDDQAGDCSITGGTVYRGPGVALQGDYVFGDYCSGRIWSLDPGTGDVTDLSAQLGAAAGEPMALTAIAEGPARELYAVHNTGAVYRIGPAAQECSDGIDNDGDGLTDHGADPGCDDASDSSERSGDLACDDGYDNDRDGLLDFPSDPDCTSPTYEVEATLFFAGSGDTLGVGSSSGSGGACGLGFEVVGILPAIMALRRRRGRRGSLAG